MQLVRAERRLGRLLDLAGRRGRQQLGRDRRLDDREQASRRTGPSGNWFSATYRTRNFTSVLGIEQLGLYMLMWSPL